jgi:LIM domain-containing protein
MSKQSSKPVLLGKIEIADGPFGPRTQALPPLNNPWSNGPNQTRPAPRTPSPPMPMSNLSFQQSPPKGSSRRRSPRLAEVDKLLEEMNGTPSFLKADEPWAFSTATPHLSSGPGPAFTDGGPMSPIEFKPTPPPKPEPVPVQKPEPITDQKDKPLPERASPAHTHKRSGSTSRFNQFPPPKNMKKPNMSPPFRRPSTSQGNRLPSPSSSPLRITDSKRNPTDIKPLPFDPPKPNFSTQDPAVQMGLDPSLRRSNTSPQEETTGDTTPIPFSQPNTQHQSFPPSSGPPKHICRGCTREIVGPSLKDSSGRLAGRYHKSCFACTACSSPFATGEFYVWHNEPFCAKHYHERNGSLCKGCGHGIEGPYAETDDKTLFHRHCFRCAECKVVFQGAEYWEVGGKVVCGKHVGGQLGMRSERRRTRFGMMGMGPGGAPKVRDRLAPPDPRWM